MNGLNAFPSAVESCTWEVFSRIADLPEGLWDEKIARNSVSLDSRLMQLCEETSPEDAFRYILFRDSQKHITGLFFVRITRIHPVSMAGIRHRLIRRLIFTAAVTATPETSGAHFWYEESVFTSASFLALVNRALFALPERFCLILFRDFFPEEARLFREPMRYAGFVSTQGLTVTRISVPETVHTPEEYLASLSGKQRYDWKRYVKNLDPSGSRIEILKDYTADLTQLYPLYLKVNLRAEEWASVPHTLSFFERIRSIYRDDAAMLTIRDAQDEKYLGWMLILFRRESSYLIYIGFEKLPDLTLWHNLLIASIEHSIRKGVKLIDLGVTHEQAKKRFGAEALPVRYFYRFRSSWLNFLIRSLFHF